MVDGCFGAAGAMISWGQLDCRESKGLGSIGYCEGYGSYALLLVYRLGLLLWVIRLQQHLCAYLL